MRFSDMEIVVECPCLFFVSKIRANAAKHLLEKMLEMGNAKGNWPMNNRLNFFKRLTAFLLAMLLVTTMMGNDFFSLATSDEIITEESVKTGDSSSAPEAAPAPEAVDIPQEPAAEEQQTPAEPGQVVEPTNNDSEIPTEPQPTVDENGNPVVVPTENQPSPETPAEPKESIDDAEITPNPENIDKPETDKTNEEDIEDPDAKDKEEGIDDEETEDEEELVKEEEEECEHEWKYVSNENGTHFRKCSKCDEEGEQEDCDYDENGVCRKCGYEDNSLVFQTFSKEILGTTVTVEGEMPRNADVTIYYVGKKAMENIVNDSLDEGIFKAYAAYDITIYDRYGNKYQPDYDNNTVKVTFESVNKLDEVPDEDVTVFRIEDDYSVTEIEADASGEDVSFDAEHFSVYVTGEKNSRPYVEIHDINKFAYIGTAKANFEYTRVDKAHFHIYADAKGDYVFNVNSYKNLNSDNDPTDGVLVSTGSQTVKVTEIGWQSITIPLEEKETGKAYVSKNNTYSVVAWFDSAPNNHVYLGYNNTYDGTYTSTYISTGDNWNFEKDYPGVFQEISDKDNPSGDYEIEVTNETSDSYQIASVKSEKDKLASGNTVVYAVGETDTLTAVLSEATAERTITWSLEGANTGIVTLASASNNPMATKITAANPGSVKLNATYKGSTFSITVNVVDIKIGGVSSKEGVASYTKSYTGKNIVPEVAVNTTTAGGAGPSYYYVTDTTVTSAPDGTDLISVSSLSGKYSIIRCDSATNTNVGTANVNIKYYYSASKVYSYDRLFTITALDVSTQNAAGKDAFDTAEFVVENGVVVDVTKINTNNALAATPVFKNGDIKVSIKNTVFNSSGIQYTYIVTGQGNFTGTVDDVVKEIKGSSIDQVAKVVINPDSQLAKYYEYTGVAYKLDEHLEANGDWSDLIFYDMQNNQLPAGAINKNNAKAVINTVDTNDGDSINAGEKEIVVTLNSGYTGSLKTSSFRIYPRSLSDAKVNWVNDKREFEYTGDPIEPKECSKDSTTDGHFYVTLKSTVGNNDIVTRIDNTNNQEYEVTYRPEANHTKTTDSPSLVLRAKGKNFESGSSLVEGYTIVPSFALNMTIRIIDGGVYNGTYSSRDENGYYKTEYNKIYDKTASKPTIRVLVDGNTLAEKNYTIGVYDDANGTVELSPSLGTKYIRVTAKADGDYPNGGTVTATYTVVPRPINNALISVDDKTGTEARKKTFNGNEQNLVPASNAAETDYDIKVTYGEDYLQYGTDYEIEYTGDRKNVTSQGVSYRIVGKGNYSGSTSWKTYTIKPATLGTTGTATATVEPDAYTYDGKPKYPTINVKTTSGTFTEQYIYTESTLESANFSVSYSNNIQPTKEGKPATVTITGKNNLTGTQVVPFTITNSTDEYQISINGKAVVPITIENPTQGYRYYKCDLNATYNGTSDYGSPVVINSKTGDVLNKNGRKTDYGYWYSNTDIVSATGQCSTSTWPYLEINGINAYYGNNAIVFFNILPVNINDTKITYKSDLDFDANNVVTPAFTINYGNKDLVLNQDYKVTCWEDKAPHKEAASTKAGVKYAVITGIGKYTGEVEREYTVGTKVSEVLVSIQSGTYNNPGNLENLKGDEWPDKQSLSKKGNALDNPLDIPYRGNHAPNITLYSKDGTESLAGSYEIIDIESTLGLTGDSLYDSRKPGEKGDDYNILKYSVKVNGSKGYYGETDENGNIKPLNIFVRIMPVNIRPGEGRVSQTGDDSPSIEYNGGQTEYKKEYKFRYGKEDDLYTLEKDKDLVGYPIMIGEEVGANQKKYVEGVGNFTNTIEYTVNVNKGYVIVSGKKDAATADTDAISINSKDTQTLNLGALYTYKENVAQLPVIKLTATNGTKVLELGTDYVITSYPSVDEQMGKENLDKDLTMTIEIKDDKYQQQTINIKYRIASNNISKFYGTLSDIPYTATTVDIDTIKKATLKLATTKGGTELTQGKDFELVETDAETQEARFQAQFGNVYSKAVVTDSLPSYQTNYIFVKGIGIYSGYCRIPFNIILDLGNDAYTKVTMPKDSYELGDDGKPTGTEYVPTIMYRDVNGAQDTYTKKLNPPKVQVTETDGTTTTKTLTNYTITRDREGKPGPDGSIAVTGAYNCTGTAKNVQSVNGKDVSFQIRLSNYGDLAISGKGIYSYTGNAVIPSIKGLADIGAIKAPVVMENDVPVIQNGEGVDYGLKYQYSSEPETNVAVKVGKWKVIVEATSTSRFFIPGTSKELEFYIKYDLANATMKFANADDTDPSKPPKVGYTGGPYSFVDNVTITDKDGSTIIYSKDQNTLVTLNPTEKTDMGEYTIVANPKDTDSAYCYGTCSTKFVISGISLDDAVVTLEKDSFEYTGKAITPKTTVKIQNGAITLKENTDYKVSYKNNINAGTATVTVEGINNYSGKKEVTFTIEKKSLKDCTISFGDAYYIGTASGLVVEPTVTIKNGTTELREGTDYTIVKYTNNSSIATAVAMGNDDPRTWNKDNMPKVKIAAVNKGNYKGEGDENAITVEFTIERLNLETNSDVKIADTLVEHTDVDANKFAAEFTGNKIDEYSVLKLSVVHNGVETPLVGKADGTGDYTVDILDSPDGSKELKAMGDYKLVVTGVKNCDGAKIVDFTIKARSLPNNYHYYYSNSHSQTGKPGFEGEWRALKESDFATAADYKPGFITTGGLGTDTLEIRVYDCTTVNEGEDNIPVVTIIDKGVKDPDVPTKNYELTENDFTLSVKNAKTAGTAEWSNVVTEDKHAKVASTSPAVTITGQGNYTGEITLPFNIGKNINNQELTIRYKVTDSTGVIHTYDYLDAYSTYESTGAGWSYNYNGREQKPTPEVFSKDNKRLSSTKDYSVSFTDALGNDDASMNAGYKYVVITGKGDYCGTMIQRYRILRKQIKAQPVIENPKTLANNGEYFTTEKDPVAKNKKEDGTFEDKTILSFKVSGLTRLNEETAKKYLKAHNLTEEQAVEYVDYYYGVYSGSPIRPTIAVYDNTLGSGNGISQISSGENGDLDISYENDNTKTIFNDDGTIVTCGTATVRFRNTGEDKDDPNSSGNYYVGSDSIKYVFRYIVVARDISNNDFVAEFADGLDEPQDYTGRALTPAVRVTNGGEPLVPYDENTEEGDYKVEYKNNVIPGKATVVITGVNNYTGSKELYFDIMGHLDNEDQVVVYHEDSNGSLVAGTPRQIYTGTSITFGNPRIYLVLVATVDYPKDVVLDAGTAYTVLGPGETDNYISYGHVIYSGVESKYWKGDRSVRYDIDFNESEIFVNNNEGDYKYTGYPIIPKFTLNVSTANITSTKYYKNNIEIDPNKDEDREQFTDKGTIEAVITYDVGSKTNNTVRTSYNIVSRPLEECEVEWERVFHRYTGEPVQPGFTVVIKSTNLQDPSEEQTYKELIPYSEETGSGDYIVDYGNYVYSTSEDDCSIILSANSDKLSGKLTGTKICPYTIKLQSVANLRVTEKTGDSLTIDWVKDLFADGTQLKIDVKQSDGTYTGYMTTRVVGNTNTFKIEGLSGSTTYKITAKSYAEPEDGVTIYSAEKFIEETTGVEESSITVKRTASDPTKATITLPKGGNVLVYYIYRSTDTTSKGKLCAIIPKDTGAYTNTNLSSGVTYYYYVKGYAINSSTGKLEPVNQSEYVEAKVE